MTIATTTGAELTVETLILRAYQMAGLMSSQQGVGGPTWLNSFTLGRDLLQTIINELATEGVFARAVNIQYLTCVSGQYVYTMPSDIFDLVGDGAYIDATQSLTAATGITPVKQIDREGFQRLATNDAQGRPVMFWVKRDVFPIQVYLWQTPTEAGSVRFQCHRLLADVSLGTVTVDLERYWTSYLIYALAAQLCDAHSQDEGKIGRLLAVAEQKKMKAKGAANQHPSNFVYMDHKSNWSC